jgi:hypothetical protein
VQRLAGLVQRFRLPQSVTAVAMPSVVEDRRERALRLR